MRFVVSVALAAIAAAGLGGCASVRAYFPSRDEVYKPVPLSVGEPRLRGRDTVYVATGAGYQLEAATRYALPDARRELDHAARRFHRYTGRWPARVLVRLVTTDGAPRETGADVPGSEEPAPSGRVITLGLPEPRRPAAGSWDTLIPDVAPPVTRLWLRAYAEDRRGFDTSHASRAARLPAWLEEALAELVAPSPTREARFARLARHADDLMPLRELLAAPAPPPHPMAAGRARAEPSATLARGPGRRPPREDVRRPLPRDLLFAAQSHALAQFILAREGPHFLARLTARLADGGTLPRALREAETLPSDLEAFETAWREWLIDEGIARQASAF